MSDYRFGAEDYGLNYYPVEAGDCWGGTDWEKVERVEIEGESFVRERTVEESEVPGLKAEIDGLRWAVEERDQLIRDLLIAYFENTECRLGDCRDCGSRDWPHECEGWLLFDRAEQMGLVD